MRSDMGGMDRPDDDQFFKQFEEMRSKMMPNKKSVFALVIGIWAINAVLFVCAVAVIAIAVKWIIS